MWSEKTLSWAPIEFFGDGRQGHTHVRGGIHMVEKLQALEEGVNIQQ